MSLIWLDLSLVFNSVNRLAGRNIYGMEVVANADRLTVEGVGGVLTFVAKHHFSKVEAPATPS
jgi:hypothetical protein